ncbi:MAG: aldo/keto reductase [Sphingobacteriia bacterium 24-36-13]|jgi:voltage-dependent potassium channel beta subunit|uniref:potassium channel beta subunit family protein n=1 Tax=Sediminibacterium sp. TaxID=1917865 RepID=UPI000BD9C3C5|nr:aldo/keto reductase [Sediminibacterium sp.]OYY11645.1 MAG: aldo/keto reductase [Sphingobacteriia bacterium 35-36-14]OYZ53845.1 MAG: aldo/keto reductase [Sphingobacteriia bacterium 24-36-13]OZA64483.1 MAG: aldo/keto reductase [Sphingobacteriia bacterium 39-36-14]HQS23655.1 aldo/keto reductase [Sediminibacterium sp.]HQS35570.1 aldo/keto reductase [Sediminibacterium sp.]
MEYRRMGRSGLQLSVLSFGSWVTFHKQINDNSADELMGIAYDNGINFFDNAEVYALGESEKMMGRVLKAKNWDRTSYTISSKAFFGWRGKENKPNQTGLSRKHLTEACHEALQRLQTDYLDLYFCHRPDKNTPIEEVVLTMNHLIQQGKILYWGTSEWSGVELMEAHRVAQHYRLIGPSMEQPQYNLFERNKIENDYLEVYKNVGLGTTIWSPLAAGLLTGKYNNGIPEGSRLAIEGFDWLKERWIMQDKIEKVQKLQLLANELGCSLPALSIAWCIKNPNVTTAILGATKKEQLIDNLTALKAVELLTSEVLSKIEAIMQNKPVLAEY